MLSSLSSTEEWKLLFKVTLENLYMVFYCSWESKDSKKGRWWTRRKRGRITKGERKPSKQKIKERKKDQNEGKKMKTGRESEGKEEK